jgi:hypothetical protein
MAIDGNRRLRLALNVVCCETAIRLQSGAKRTSLARAQSVADDDPKATSLSQGFLISIKVSLVMLSFILGHEGERFYRR